MNMMQPYISVLIPTYNCEKLISRTIDSLLDNTLISFCELIFCDDGSTDNTLQILQNYKLELENKVQSFTIISNEQNLGVAGTRQKLLDSACGQYIIFVDADDWVDKYYLEKLFRVAEDESADVVVCNLSMVYATSSKIIEEQPSPDNILASKQLLREEIHGFLVVKLINLTFLRKNGISFASHFNYLEDLVFTLKLYSKAKKISAIKDVLYYYDRTNPNSITASLTDSKIQDFKKALMEIKRYLIEEDLFNKLEEDFFLQERKLFFNILTRSSFQQKLKYSDFLSNKKNILFDKRINPCFHNRLVLFCFANKLSFVGILIQSIFKVGHKVREKIGVSHA